MRAALIALLAVGCGRVRFDDRVDPSDRVDARSADAVTDSSSAPVLLQQAGNSSTGSTLSATLPSVPEPGHVLVFAGAGSVAPLTPPSGGSSTWNLAVSSTTNANIEIWFGVADGAGATVTIVAPGTTDMSMWVGEWSNLDSGNPLDQTVAQDGLTSPASPGTLVTRHAPDLLIFAVRDFVPNTFGPPTDGMWTLLDERRSGTDQAVWSEWLDQTPVTATPTVSETNHGWDAAIAAFRALP